MSNTTQTPASLGFSMPAEWAPHAGTLLSWPYNLNTWEGHLEGAEQTMAQVITELTKHERVDLLVANAEVEARARRYFDPLKLSEKQLRYLPIEAGDVWIRDYGPIFLTRDSAGKHEVAWNKSGYNAYGKPEEYADLLIGNEVPAQLPFQDLQNFNTGIILEGGSIDVNGTGTMITTESCLLSPTRNPNLTKVQIEERLRQYFGVTNILWLLAGIEGDDTTGHVDDITRFVSQNTVVTVTESNPQDANYAPLQENLERLRCMKDERGEKLTVLELPMPREFVVDGRRMAASYANFYIANQVVLVPTYAQPSDAQALGVLQECFLDRRVIGIDSREFIWGYGSIHCSTQQIPA
jgi:agmatine deiminase